MVPQQDIDHGRRRLLALVCLVLAGFAGLSVALTTLGPDVLAPLQLTPTVARVGMLVLTIGLIALVWEKERDYKRLSATVAKQNVMLVAFDNRIKVVENLLEIADRLNSPLAVDDVLKIILDAAVELVGAEGGSVEFNQEDGDVSIAHTHFIEDKPESEERQVIARFPLMIDDRKLGMLTLTFPITSKGFDSMTLEVLEQFTRQAGKALQKAQVLARERATVAYLEAANVVKARFLNAVSHELRTPLTSIIGFSSTLENHWGRLDDPEKREFVSEIHNQGEKLGEIVERLLEAARVELQGIILQPVLHDVRQSVEEALLPFFAAGADRLKVALPDRPIHAEVDPFVVDQVISNLVDNSLRYTIGSVRVSLEAHQTSVVIRVSDTGPGIHKTHLERVMDPFYRLDDDLHAAMGSGLHIVRTLVESHGGRGEIESDEKGTSAAIVLPRAASAGSTSRMLDGVRV